MIALTFQQKRPIISLFAAPHIKIGPTEFKSFAVRNDKITRIVVLATRKVRTWCVYSCMINNVYDGLLQLVKLRTAVTAHHGDYLMQRVWAEGVQWVGVLTADR